MPTPRNPKSANVRKPLVYGAVVVVAAGLLGFASYQATSPDRSSRDTVTEVSTEPETVYQEMTGLSRRDAEDGLAIGRADAPVVLIEYADFRCGYCAKFARDTEPELIEKYVKDGTLRIEWRNFPIFGEESENAARGAWAAGQQGRFWEYHRAAYAEGSKEKGFDAERVEALAEEAGVKDMARFRKDVDGEPARNAVTKDQNEGYSLGVASTPSFLINGRPISGAQPGETFTEAIEAAAESAK